jgi:hypothetical protein
MSVKSGYAYFALDLESMQVVRGDEPEYEETLPLASSLGEMFEMLISRDPPRVEDWV